MDLKTLCELNGTSGDEQAVRRAILEAAKMTGANVKIDRMGNVVAFKKGSAPAGKPHVCLSAHMDEVGFIVIGATDEGLLAFKPVGGIDPRVVVSKHVKVGGLDGVIGALAIHLQTKEQRAHVLPFSELYIDIGAKTKDEALEKAPPATYVYFESSYLPFGQGFVTAKALDDRVGCYNLLRLLDGDYACDVTCAFVTQEEVGLRGATGAAYLIDPDVALVLEGTAAGDMSDVPASRHVCDAGKGVAVSFMDNASIADQTLYQAMLKTALKENIPCQVKRGVTGGNDAGAYQRAKAGARTLVLSVPCRYIHGPSSVCALSDVEAQYELAKAYLMSV